MSFPLTLICKAGNVSVWYELGDAGRKEGWWWGLHTKGSKASFVHQPFGPFNSRTEAYESARRVHIDLPTWQQLSKNGAV